MPNFPIHSFCKWLQIYTAWPHIYNKPVQVTDHTLHACNSGFLKHFKEILRKYLKGICMLLMHFLDKYWKGIYDVSYVLNSV